MKKNTIQTLCKPEIEPLHNMTENEVSNKMVSAHSCWKDNYWFFDNPTAGQNATASTIKWDFLLYDGSNFMDDKWRVLQRLFKRLAWSLIYAYNGKRFKPGSYQPISMGIQTIASFMAKNEITQFSELDNDTLDAYKEYVANAVYGDNDNTTFFGWSAFYPYLGIVSIIRKQAAILQSMGIAPLPTIPWGGQSIKKLSDELANKAEGAIPPIPDAAFCKSLNTAYEIIENADDIIADAHSLYNDYVLGERRAELDVLLNKKSGITNLTDACLITLQGGTGVRASEACGIKTKTEDADPRWPSCVGVKKSLSGLHEVFVLAGHLFKTVNSSIPVEWTLGIRPVGSNYIPIPVRAIIILDRLYQPWRSDNKIDNLCVSFMNQKTCRFITSISAASLGNADKRFFQFCGITDWNVSTHQWRKTFAQFIIRSDARMLPALKDHFKHMSIAMTEAGYVNADPEMKQSLEDARIQFTINEFYENVSGKKRIYGPLAKHFDAIFIALRQRFNNYGPEKAKEALEDIIRSEGIRAYPLGRERKPYGTCMHRIGFAKCGDECKFKYALTQPLWSAVSPDLCWECENLVYDDSHLSFWIDRLADIRASIQEAVEAGNVALRLYEQKREVQALIILNNMGYDPLGPREPGDANAA